MSDNLPAFKPREPDATPDPDERRATLSKEADALAAISTAMADLPEESAERIATWARSLAGSTERRTLQTVLKYAEGATTAVKRHRDQNRDPTKADAELYMAVFGHEGLRPDMLAVLYALPNTAEQA